MAFPNEMFANEYRTITEYICDGGFNNSICKIALNAHALGRSSCVVRLDYEYD